MMKKLWIPMMMLLLMGTASCQGNKEGTGGQRVQALAIAPPPVAKDEKATQLTLNDKGRQSADNTPSATPDTSKKIIKEGEMSFETSNLADTRNMVVSVLKSYVGYVSEENQSNNNDMNRQEATLKVRIPASKFDHFIDSISTKANHIDFKNIRITDVTTQFIDVTTRLNNQKLLENRYKQLLANAGKMSDILDIEAKLNEIRTEIESNQGQLNYLNKQVAYSSLDITFYTKRAEANTGNGFGYRIKTALGDGWYIMQSIFFGVITLWPVVLLLLVLVWLFRRWRKRISEKRINH
jgi:hypothetical protein